MKLRAAFISICLLFATATIGGCGHSSNSSLVPGVAQEPAMPFGVDNQPLSDFPNTPELNTAGAKPAIFVANPTAVLEFLESATGNALPLKKIEGAETQIVGATGIAVSPAGNIYVSTASNGILVFGAGQMGNVAPLQHITGQSGIGGVALDSAGNIYVDEAASVVKVFAPSANGAATPIRTFSSAAIKNPKGITLDASNKVYIANFGDDSITVFAAGASGSVSPIRTIAGAATTIASPMGISVDVAGNIFLAEHTGKFLVFGPTQNGNMPPMRTVNDAEAGSALDGIGTSISGRAIVANAAGSLRNDVETFAKNATGTNAPIMDIHGSSTGLSQPGPVGLLEQLQTVGVRLFGESSKVDPHYGMILGYFNGTTATTTSVVMLTACDPVQFKNVDSGAPHTASFLGNATATNAPWPPTFTGGGTTPSASGSAIGSPGFTTGQLNPGQKSRIYSAGGPGFYMIGCFFHYSAFTMRDVFIVQ
jgi:hypothetical protein